MWSTVLCNEKEWNSIYARKSDISKGAAAAGMKGMGKWLKMRHEGECSLGKLIQLK